MTENLKFMPSFLTFTGADKLEYLDVMINLSAQYPIEWGILISNEKAGTSRFPDTDTIKSFQASPLKLSAHICGDLSDRIIAGHTPHIDLFGFSRAQINRQGKHLSSTQIKHVIDFGYSKGIRPIIQCAEKFPNDERVDWLLDTSFGTGKELTHFPAIPNMGPFCGYSGGIGSDNIGQLLSEIQKPHQNSAPFWLDMESKLRVDNIFVPDICEKTCQNVFGN